MATTMEMEIVCFFSDGPIDSEIAGAAKLHRLMPESRAMRLNPRLRGALGRWILPEAISSAWYSKNL